MRDFWRTLLRLMMPMFRVSALILVVNMMSGSAFHVYGQATKVFDLTPTPGGKIHDSVSNVDFGSGDQFDNQNQYFRLSDGAIRDGEFIFGAPDVKDGFTIAAQLDSEQKYGETIFYLTQIETGEPALLFTLIRQPDGRFYIGKAQDEGDGRPHFQYLQRLWDPVSVCATKKCITDTVYASFQANGQIVIDEIATYADPERNTAVAYSWQTGLLNFGLPLKGYNPTRDMITTPTSPLQFMNVDFLEVRPILGAVFGPPMPPSLNEDGYYLQATYRRLAVWKGGTLGNAGILADQNAVNPNLQVQPDWLTCSSGRFETPPGKYDPGKTPQYWPRELRTPCTAPTAPPIKSILMDPLTVSWMPAFAQAGRLSEYVVQFRVPGVPADRWECAEQSVEKSQCVLSGIPDKLSGKIAVYATANVSKGAGALRYASPVSLSDTLPPIGTNNAVQDLNLESIANNPTVPDRSLRATWKAPRVVNAPLPIFYHLALKAANREPIVEVVPNSTMEYTFSNLSPHVAYTLTVVAENRNGLGVSAQAFKTTPTWKPLPPENLRIVHGIDGAYFYWWPPSDDGGEEIKKYIVKVNGVQDETPAISMVINGTLKPKTTYSVEIYSNNGSADSLKPLVGSFTTDALPSTPGVPYPMFKPCALLNSSCIVGTNGVIAFGNTRDGGFIFRTVLPGTSSQWDYLCAKSEFFNKNPKEGLVNSCYFAAASDLPTPPAGATFCSFENKDTCFIPKNTFVAFGINSQYKINDLLLPANTTMRYVCKLGDYDPAVGKTKACFYYESDNYLNNSAAHRCASENELCRAGFTPRPVVNFGILLNGRPNVFVTKPFDTSIQCSADAIGYKNLPRDAEKVCYVTR